MYTVHVNAEMLLGEFLNDTSNVNATLLSNQNQRQLQVIFISNDIPRYQKSKTKRKNPPHYPLESSIQPIHSTMSVVLLKPVTIKMGMSDTYISTIITIFQAQCTLPVVFYIWRWIKLRTIFSASVRTLQLKERMAFIPEGQESQNLSRKIVSK